MLADRPEGFIMMIRLMELSTETMNGPCPYNQRLLYKYRTDAWTGILLREIDDINSIFYILKDNMLEFVFGMIEGEGSVKLPQEVKDKYGADKFLCTKHMLANLNPSEILKHMYRILKRLALWRKMDNHESFRNSILRKIQKRREEIERNDRREKIKSDKDINDWKKKKEAGDKMFSPFDNRSSLITEEMIEQYEFTDYKELVTMYKKDRIFSDHLVVKICLKFYSLLENLAALSRNYKQFLHNHKLRLGKFYKEQLDLDDRVSISSKEQLIKVDTKLDEELIFFMFILKISKRLEISLPNPDEESDKRIQKIIYFPLLPSTYYLESKTKLDTIKALDLSNRRSDFQSRFDQFFLEMDQNYELNLSNPLFHFLSKNKTFHYQKIFCWSVGFLINVLIIVFYELDENTDLDNRDLVAESKPKKWINILSLVFACYTFIQFSFWLIFRSWRQFKIQRMLYLKDNPTEKDEVNRFSKKVYIFFIMTFFNSDAAVNFLCHLLFAIFHLVFNPLFSSFHLLLVINISSTAKYVAKASTVHLNQLMITLVLAVFLIYSFSTLNAEYFSGAFDSEGVNDIDICKNMRTCLLYILNLGLRNGGGIADSHTMYSLSEKGTAKVLWKTFFDLMFFFVVNVIALNIIFGIIIDTFSELRGVGEERGKLKFVNNFVRKAVE
jgi:hypothetical protein